MPNPTTLVFTDHLGRDVERANFGMAGMRDILEWAERMLAMAGDTPGAVVFGYRVEVAQ